MPRQQQQQQLMDVGNGAIGEDETANGAADGDEVMEEDVQEERYGLAFTHILCRILKKLAASSTPTSSLTWITWFCSLPGHEYFCEVQEEFLEDEFNLTGLNSMVPFWKEAMDMVLDVEAGRMIAKFSLCAYILTLPQRKIRLKYRTYRSLRHLQSSHTVSYINDISSHAWD